MTSNERIDDGTPPSRLQEEATPEGAIGEMLQSRPMTLWRRVVLTYRYLGLRAVAYRLVTFPLRRTAWRRRLNLGRGVESEQARAAQWYRQNGRRVAVVIPTYGPPDVLERALESIRDTTTADKIDDHRRRRRERARARRSGSSGSRASASSSARRTSASPGTSTVVSPPRTRAMTSFCSIPTSLRCRAGCRACSSPPTPQTTSALSAPSSSTRTGGSSTPACTAISARPNGSITASASRRAVRPSERHAAGARGHRCMHVRPPRSGGRHRPARRPLPDGV